MAIKRKQETVIIKPTDYKKIQHIWNKQELAKNQQLQFIILLQMFLLKIILFLCLFNQPLCFIIHHWECHQTAYS